MVLLLDIWRKYTEMGQRHTESTAQCRGLESTCRGYEVEVSTLRETCRVMDAQNKYLQTKMSGLLHHNRDLTTAVHDTGKSLAASTQTAGSGAAVDKVMESYSKQQVECGGLQRENVQLKKELERLDDGGLRHRHW